LAVGADFAVLQGVVLLGGLLRSAHVGGGLRRDVGPAAEQVDRYAVGEVLVVRRIERRGGDAADRIAAGGVRIGRSGVGIYRVRSEEQPVDTRSVVVDVVLAGGTVVEVTVELPVAEDLRLEPEGALMGDVLGNLPGFAQRVARGVLEI